MDRRILFYVAFGVSVAIGLGAVIGTVDTGSFHASIAEQDAERATAPSGQNRPASYDASSATLKQLRGELSELRDHKRDEHSHDGINQKLAGFESRLASLDSTLTAIQAALESMRENDTDAELGFEQSVPSPEEQAAAVERKAQQQLNAFEDQLTREVVDQAWASDTVSELHTAFQRDELSDIQVLETRCASTLCRLDLAFDTTVPPEDSLQRLSHHRPWDGQAFVTVDTDGLARIYVSRPGYDLPAIDIEGE